MATLYEYYNTGDDDVAYIADINWIAQSFRPSTAHTITSVKLLLLRGGSPGTITVSIRASDPQQRPTGADLCSGTTNGNTLPNDSPYEWREIILGDGYALLADTRYAIVVRAPDAVGGAYVDWRYDGSSPTYTGGLYNASSNSGDSWTTNSARDLMFEDWGEPAVTFISTVIII